MQTLVYNRHSQFFKKRFHFYNIKIIYNPWYIRKIKYFFKQLTLKMFTQFVMHILILLCTVPKNENEKTVMINSTESKINNKAGLIYRVDQKIKKLMSQNEAIKKEIIELETSIELNKSKIKEKNEELSQLNKNEYSLIHAVKNSILDFQQENLNIERVINDKKISISKNDQELQSLNTEKKDIVRSWEKFKMKKKELMKKRFSFSSSSTDSKK